MAPAEDYIYHRHPHELSGGHCSEFQFCAKHASPPDVSRRGRTGQHAGRFDPCGYHQHASDIEQEENTAMVSSAMISRRPVIFPTGFAVMYLGRIVETGITDEVLHNPRIRTPRF